MTRKIKWNKKDLNSGQDSTGVSNIQGIKGTENGISQGYQHGSLTKGLVAYYPMERGKGQIIRDAALNNQGNINGASWATDSAVGDYAIEGDGSSYVETTTLGGFGSRISQDFTVSLWFKSSGVNDDGVISTYDGDNGLFMRFGVGGTPASDELALQIVGDGDARRDYASGEVFDDGNWHHVVWVKQGEGSGEFKLFRDGSEVSLTTDTDHGITSSSSFTEPVAHLAHNNQGSIEDHLDGSLDDVRIYNRTLSKPEIEALYNLSRPNGVLVEESDVPSQNQGGVSRWRFDDDQDTDTAKDSWGGNDGTINGATYTSNAVYGNALEFDGSSDYVDVLHSKDFEVGEFTISLWFDWDSVGTDDADFLTSKRQNEDEFFELHTGGGSGVDGLRFIPAVHEQSTLDVKDIIADGWNHVVVSYSHPKAEAKLFHNGVLAGSKEDIEDAVDPATCTEDFRIGRRTNGDYPFNGIIDDVRIYNRALKPVEVEKLFNKGAYRINRGDTLQ